MARPRKENADYFPHDTDMRSHRKVIALRTKYGLQGYAVYSMLLEHIGSCDYFESQRDDIEKEIIAGDFGVSAAELSDIVSYCVRLGLLQLDNDKLKCKSLTDRLKDLIEKRERERNRVTATETTQPTTGSPQSKVKKIKVKEKEILQEEPPEGGEQAPVVYGDPEINMIIEKIGMFNGGVIDGTKNEQRRYGKMLLDKIKDIPSVQEKRYTVEGILDMILSIISKNEYHSHKIVGPKKLFYNLAGLMQVCKQELAKTKKSAPKEF